MRMHLKITITMVTVLLGAHTAFAGGFEHTARGSKALGRGGAFAVRADGPLALHYNPAALASQGGPELLVDLQLSVLSACAELAGTYRYGVSDNTPSIFGAPGDYAAESFPKVCNDAFPTISPYLIQTIPLSERFGIGFGLITPAAMSEVRWGNSNGSVDTANGLRPTPTRYQSIESRLIELFPTIGIGWKANEWLELGAAFSWGIGSYDFTSNSAPLQGTTPAADIRTQLVATDYFLPAITISGRAQLHERVAAMLGAHWIDSIGAGGELRLRTSDYGTSAEGGNVPRSETVDADLDVPARLKLSTGLRYAHPRGTGSGSSKRQDALDTELFDVELNLTYEFNSMTDDFIVNTPGGAQVIIQQFGGNEQVLPVPEQTVIPYRWSDQLGVQLGGDYNVLPGMLALRAGTSFETRGVDPAYQGLTFWPMQRLGLHAGATLRLGSFDISVAYAHLVQETIEVGADPAQGLGETSGSPDGTAAYPQVVADTSLGSGFIVNAGRYRSSFDVVAVAVNYRFQ